MKPSPSLDKEFILYLKQLQITLMLAKKAKTKCLKYHGYDFQVDSRQWRKHSHCNL